MGSVTGAPSAHHVACCRRGVQQAVLKAAQLQRRGVPAVWPWEPGYRSRLCGSKAVLRAVSPFKRKVRKMESHVAAGEPEAREQVGTRCVIEGSSHRAAFPADPREHGTRWWRNEGRRSARRGRSCFALLFSFQAQGRTRRCMSQAWLQSD